MKLSLVMVAGALTLGWTAQGALYTFDFTSGLANGGAIPDANPTGWSDTRTLSGIADYQITDVNVKLNLTGGYNGDLYAYLVHGSGFAVLLNRVGTGTGSEPTYSFGYATSGFSNIKLDDALGTSIHNVETPGAGNSYASDGGTLASFNNLDPNGNWTIFFADLAGGDQSTVVSWGLEISAVPEPTAWAAIIFGTMFIGVQIGRGVQKRKLA